MSKRNVAILCGFLVALFYAYNFTAAKEVTPEYIGPYGLSWYRVVITCSIFWIIATIVRPKDKMTIKELPLIALAAFCGVGFNILTFMKGLSLTSPISASVLMVTTPIIVLVLSAIFLKERLYASRILGIIIGFSGAALLISLSGNVVSINATDPLLGNTLIFVNAISYSFYIILAKKLTARYNVFTLMKWLYFFGVIYITPFAYTEIIAFDPFTASTSTLILIGYVVLFATFGTYMLNIIAIKTLKPSVVAVFVYLQPLLTTIIALALGKDEINIYKIGAGLLIFAGVFITSIPKKASV